MGANSFLYELTPNEMGGINEDRIASLKVYPFTLTVREKESK